MDGHIDVDDRVSVDWVILRETKCVDQSSLLVAMDGVLTL